MNSNETKPSLVTIMNDMIKNTNNCLGDFDCLDVKDKELILRHLHDIECYGTDMHYLYGPRSFPERDVKDKMMAYKMALADVAFDRFNQLKRDAAIVVESRGESFKIDPSLLDDSLVGEDGNPLPVSFAISCVKRTITGMPPYLREEVMTMVREEGSQTENKLHYRSYECEYILAMNEICRETPTQTGGQGDAQ